ncbi:MAG: S8 family serine peptidase [Bacteroidia bacterium]
MKKLFSLFILFFAIIINTTAKPQPEIHQLFVRFTQNLSAEELNTLVQSVQGIKPTDARNRFPYKTTLLELAENADYKVVSEELNKLDVVAFVAPLYNTGKNQFITTGDEFFVKLNHAGELQQLRELALQTKTKIIGENQFISNVYKLRVDKHSQANPFELSKYFMQVGNFAHAQPNYNFTPTVTTDDPRFNRQWNLYNEGTPQQYNGTPGADMKVTEAWQITMGSSDIKVGILDSGVDTLHEDLIGDGVTVSNLLAGYDACQDSAQNTKGYPTPNFDNDGHGTCCAGIACAIADNGLGIAGIAPNCKIVPIRVFYYITVGVGGDPIPWSTSEFFVNGISWQWQVADVDVSSNSWGITDSFLALFPGQDSIVNIAINEAVNSGRNGKGLPVLHSSGNDGLTDTIPIWPARTDIVISVNATSMCDEWKSNTSCDNETWWGGNWGDGLDVSAPGVKIPATDMNGTNGFSASSNYYNTFNGTSAACPNAAGVMALMLSIRPELTQAQARSILESTCDTVGGYDYSTAGPSGPWSEELGHGRINAKRAVEKARDYVIIPPSLEIGAYVYYDDTEQNSYLHYNVANAGKVVIEWFDINGAKALLVDDDNHAAGQFNLLIEKPNYAAGIFIARLQINDRERTLKFFMSASKTEY